MMKKLIILLTLIAIPFLGYAQSKKITDLPVKTSAGNSDLMYAATATEDTIRSITKLAFLTDVTLTGTTIMATPFTLGATSVTTNGTELNILDGALWSAAEGNMLVGIGGTTIANQLVAKAPINNTTLTGNTAVTNMNVGAGGVFDSIQIDVGGGEFGLYDGANLMSPKFNPAAKGSLGDVAILLTDTLSMGAMIGWGHAGDTVLFSTGDIIWMTKIGGSHNVVIRKVNAVNSVTGKDVDINLYFDANQADAAPTTVLSSDLTVTSFTTGDDATGFSNATVASGNFLWVTVNQATAQPTRLTLTIYYSLTDVF